VSSDECGTFVRHGCLIYLTVIRGDGEIGEILVCEYSLEKGRVCSSFDDDCCVFFHNTWCWPLNRFTMDEACTPIAVGEEGHAHSIHLILTPTPLPYVCVWIGYWFVEYHIHVC